ncbi:efflux RND transporter permease subunit [Paracoccus sp. PAR01]|uniref:efflux RND transporter permease subunit n=1 Tax=Paracoccus sp. PAR01 TaxID=2769282 RepID=UPI00351CA3C7
MTLLALSLVVGILVDDAIVEVENIERHLRMGKTAYKAADEASDESQTRVTLTAEPGTTIERTDASAMAAAAIKGVEHVTSTFVATGTASTGGMGGTSEAVNTATLVVNLTPIDDRNVKQSEIEADLRRALAAIPGVRGEIGSGGNGTQLQVALAGDDSAVLEDAAARLETQMRSNLTGVGNITSSATMQSPEIVITPDLARAASPGVTARAISDAIRIATAGAYDTALSKLNLPQRQVAIRVMLDERNREMLDQIALIPGAGANGKVALDAWARPRLSSTGWTPSAT